MLVVGKTFYTTLSYYYDNKVVKNDTVIVLEASDVYIALRSVKCEREYGVTPEYFGHLTAPPTYQPRREQ
jgi:hypothetical protein